MTELDPAKIIDGKATAAEVRQRLADEVAQLKEKTGRQPGLAAVLVGEDPASEIYVRNKRKACDKTGIFSELHRLGADTTQQELLDLVARLNEEKNIHGILVQLPLPDAIDPDTVIDAISAQKDVDGFHPYSVGRLSQDRPIFRAATPYGIMTLLEKYEVDLKGKEAVIVGRSNIVGKPIGMLLLAQHATVTTCHSRTQDLKGVVGRGDVVIAAVGRAKMIKGDWLKPGAVVIDVGMNRDENDKLCGDVDFESAYPVASKITPVPGGVGPMTIAMLLANTVHSFKRAEGLG